MPRTRAKDYGSVHDAEALDPVKPDAKAQTLGQLENPSLPTNPDPEKYLDHNKGAEKKFATPNSHLTIAR